MSEQHQYTNLTKKKLPSNFCVLFQFHPSKQKIIFLDNSILENLLYNKSLDLLPTPDRLVGQEGIWCTHQQLEMHDVHNREVEID